MCKWKNHEVVDVFRVWECYDRSWFKNAPILIRFDDIDMLFDVSGQRIHDDLNAVDIRDSTFLSSLFADVEQEEKALCLCWLSDPDLHSIAGEEKTPEEILQMLFH